MAVVFMTDPATGRCALYNEPTTSGAPDNPNSARNAPLNNPATNLASLYYHSDYDPMEVAIDTGNIPITHATVPANAAPGTPAAGIQTEQTYGGYSDDYLVYTHGLGYVPDFLAASGSQILSPGFPVQSATDGRCRFVSFYATTTQIRAYETAMQTGNALGSTTLNYSLLILRQPPAASGNILLDFNPGTGIVQMARGKFRSDRSYLQIIPGGSPFAIPTGKTVDLENGTFRSVAPDGTVRDIVPSTFRISMGAYGVQYGPAGSYSGSFTGEAVIQVRAP